METKQTAVDWLIQTYLRNDKIDKFDLEVAKQMEQEQCKRDFLAGYADAHDWPPTKKTAQDYYNETYGTRDMEKY